MIWFRAKWWCVTDQHTPTNQQQQFTFHFTWCCGSQFHPAFVSKLSLTLQISATANRVANVGSKLSANGIDVNLTFKRLRIFWDTRSINFKNEMNRRCIVTPIYQQLPSLLNLCDVFYAGINSTPLSCCLMAYTGVLNICLAYSISMES